MPGQHSETSQEAFPPYPQPIDPPDEPGLLDFDSSDIASREASVEVLDGPADQEVPSGGEDTVDSDDVHSICQGMR